MKYKILLILLILINGCSSHGNYSHKNKLFTAKGFAYIYTEQDYLNKVINKKFDNNVYQVSQNSLRTGSLIKIINLKTNESITLKNSKRTNYPDFYKILITKPVAEKLKLSSLSPLVEIVEVKRNKSFIAKKTKIYKEEEKIHSNAPVESVKIDNISKEKRNSKKKSSEKFTILIAEFYSKDSALILKRRITQELTNFNSKKLFIKSNNANKTSLLSGPYNSINLMKNDYIELKKFGFEDLDLNIYE